MTDPRVGRTEFRMLGSGPSRRIVLKRREQPNHASVALLMSTHYELTSHCECQATLGARLDEQRLVLDGWCTRHGAREKAQAMSLGASATAERFDVSWHCPRCGRNSLRTFHEGALIAVPAPAEPPTPSASAEAST